MFPYGVEFAQGEFLAIVTDFCMYRKCGVSRNTTLALYLGAWYRWLDSELIVSKHCDRQCRVIRGN